MEGRGRKKAGGKKGRGREGKGVKEARMAVILPLAVVFISVLITWYVGTKVLMVWRRYKEMSRISDKLPGLPRHWFFGNAHQITTFSDFLMQMQTQFVDKGARMYPMWLFFLRPILIVAHPDTVKSLLRIGEPKPQGPLDGYTFLKPWLGESILISGGAKWERVRRLLTPAFHFDVLGPYFKIFNEVADVFLDKLGSMSKEGSVEVFKPAGIATLDTLLRCSLSYNGNVQTVGESHPYVTAVNRLGKLVLKRALNLHHYPAFIYKFTKDGKEFHQLSEYVHEFSQQIIRKRRQELEENPEATKKKYLDFLDILLTARDPSGQGLTNWEIQNEVDTFMFAGHDTTACVLSWSIYIASGSILRSRKKSTKKSVRDDIMKFRYLPCFLKEVMRMYTPVPVIARKTSQPHVLDGIEIPEGTYVDINIYHMHHHPDVWEDPWVFRPERFLENTEKDPYSFIPFAAGPRNCIGQNFALNEEKVIISRLVRRELKMGILLHFLATFLFIHTVSSDCGGAADIVFAVPGSWEIPTEEFLPFETFLTMLVDYFKIDRENINVGLILYGKEPVAISLPQPMKDQMETNTRITLLTQRESYAYTMSGDPDVVGALRLMRQMFKNPAGYPMQGPRPGAKQIGVIFTYGQAPPGSVDEIIDLSNEIKDMGVHMYAVGRSRVGPEFARIGSDPCSLFSMGSFMSGLPNVLPYLGSSLCTALDPSVNASEFNCFPKLWRPDPNPPIICPMMREIFQDPYNCAYYYKCDMSVASRERCPSGMLFDNFIRTCNHKDAVTCYSMIKCPQPTGLFPHPQDCDKFLNCFDDIPYIQSCPIGLYYNEVTKLCDELRNVNCLIP
ncbi:hypothetical protein FSP39_014278 [Pinctada imbricata]|uniref:Uncharacterized protein n=1 Tax=Pinctada imbricata TaxID=66713 RepID=A0AA89BJD4_PINIB|nr:hypothetical protein FSP39_014278 [Pinctada imbricata]